MNNVVLYQVAKNLAFKYEFLELDSIYNRIKKLSIAIEDERQLSFPMEKYSEEDITDFFEIFISILDSQDSIIENKKKSKQFNPNRKLIHMIINGDLDLPLDSLLHIFLYQGYHKSKYNSSSVTINFEIMYKDLTKVWNTYLQKFRSIIRYGSGTPYEKCMDCMNKFIREYVVGILNENRIKHNHMKLYNPLMTTYVNRKMVETFCDIFMQSVIYLIINNEKISNIEKKHSVLQKLLDAITNYEKTLLYDDTEAEQHPMTWDFAIHIDYIEMRNEYINYFKIFDLLCNQMQEDGYTYEVKSEYECRKRYLQDFKHKRDYQEIILEGRQEKPERFAKYLCDCQELCILLYLIAGRQLHPNYLQHIKVVYREIIEDKLRYNNKQSRTILRNLENMELPAFQSIRESAFIREKISRGLFREKGWGKYYKIKCEIQKKLYECMLKAYECNDEFLKEKRLKQVFIHLKKIMLHEMEGL